MAGLINDDKGQWITLSGLTVSLSLVIVAVLISQSGVTGYYSSYAVLEIPKEEIRELKTQTHETAKSAAQVAWVLNNTSKGTVVLNFTQLLISYNKQMNTIYAVHGRTVDITLYALNNDTYAYVPENNSMFNSTNSTNISAIWLNITYDDGTTRYASTPEIIEVKQ